MLVQGYLLPFQALISSHTDYCLIGPVCGRLNLWFCVFWRQEVKKEGEPSKAEKSGEVNWEY